MFLTTGVKLGILILMKKCVVFRVKLVKITMLLLLIINLVTTIYSVSSQNDLGIMVTNNLSQKMHINQMICKDNRIDGGRDPSHL